ncbi:MAG: HDOD domain-containing protein [Aromatoleum sp.]|jgi:HD-like signal output (HDOD) protein|uniref:HDOD domain-containing protein n=1 Tax=Aromatoleum sp. TaxID=2307007 RepID=UPI002895FE57|nr:HDOD domain-containing protein [Aromatoleum sp.]MDT3672248.1 HDOD domain-containing protein [Aromatoleum sp.]
MTAQNAPANRFLMQIADDLSSGDVNFPTFLDAAMKIRIAMNNPDITVEALSRLILTEPLVAAKIIRLANSVALNPSGIEVGDVRSAVMRVGFSSIRSIAISVAIEQLMLEKQMGPYLAGARQLWEHSIEVAALSFVIARRMTNINPHEAMFAGLVHDIGHFYLLSRIAHHPEMLRDHDDVGRLLFEWHASIGHAVLGVLETPDRILEAVSDHEIAFDGDVPVTLANVLHLTNRLAANVNPFAPPEGACAAPADVAVAAIIDESRDELRSLITAVKG